MRTGKTKIERICSALFLIAMIFSFSCDVTAQTDETKSQESGEEKTLKQLKDETKYLSPVRYVIVYNDISGMSLKGRFVEIIIAEKQFDEKNLISVFNLIKNSFPTPLYLHIEVHTSLETIETPEEREIADSGNEGRFGNKINNYQTAAYIRSNDGKEAFIYTTTLSPYQRKRVSMANKR